jgi:hypothetical protein
MDVTDLQRDISHRLEIQGDGAVPSLTGWWRREKRGRYLLDFKLNPFFFETPKTQLCSIFLLILPPPPLHPIKLQLTLFRFTNGNKCESYTVCLEFINSLFPLYDELLAEKSPQRTKKHNNGYLVVVVVAGRPKNIIQHYLVAPNRVKRCRSQGFSRIGLSSYLGRLARVKCGGWYIRTTTIGVGV